VVISEKGSPDAEWEVPESGIEIECHGCSHEFRGIPVSAAGVWATLTKAQQRKVRTQWSQIKSWARARGKDTVPTATVYGILKDGLDKLKAAKIDRSADLLLHFAMVERPPEDSGGLLDRALCALIDMCSCLELFRRLKVEELDGPASNLWEETNGLVDRYSREQFAARKLEEFGFRSRRRDS